MDPLRLARVSSSNMASLDIQFAAGFASNSTRRRRRPRRRRHGAGAGQVQDEPTWLRNLPPTPEGLPPQPPQANEIPQSGQGEVVLPPLWTRWEPDFSWTQELVERFTFLDVPRSSAAPARVSQSAPSTPTRARQASPDSRPAASVFAMDADDDDEVEAAEAVESIESVKLRYIQAIFSAPRKPLILAELRDGLTRLEAAIAAAADTEATETDAEAAWRAGFSLQPSVQLRIPTQVLPTPGYEDELAQQLGGLHLGDGLTGFVGARGVGSVMLTVTCSTPSLGEYQQNIIKRLRVVSAACDDQVAELLASLRETALGQQPLKVDSIGNAAMPVGHLQSCSLASCGTQQPLQPEVDTGSASKRSLVKTQEVSTALAKKPRRSQGPASRSSAGVNQAALVGKQAAKSSCASPGRFFLEAEKEATLAAATTEFKKQMASVHLPDNEKQRLSRQVFRRVWADVGREHPTWKARPAFLAMVRRERAAAGEGVSPCWMDEQLDEEDDDLDD